MQTITWRKMQNKKVTKDFLALTDYEREFLRHNRKITIRNIIIGIAIFLFFMLAVGLAGKADLEIIQKTQ